MCGKCEGEPYRGVRALFNGDLQVNARFDDRADWKVISPKIIVYLGKSVLSSYENPLFRGCEQAIGKLSVDDRIALDALSDSLGRPTFGTP